MVTVRARLDRRRRGAGGRGVHTLESPNGRSWEMVKRWGMGGRRGTRNRGGEGRARGAQHPRVHGPASPGRTSFVITVSPRQVSRSARPPSTVQTSRPSFVHSGLPPPAPANAHGRPPSTAGPSDRPPGGSGTRPSAPHAATALPPASRSTASAASAAGYPSPTPGPRGHYVHPNPPSEGKGTPCPAPGSVCGLTGNSPARLRPGTVAGADSYSSRGSWQRSAFAICADSRAAFVGSRRLPAQLDRQTDSHPWRRTVTSSEAEQTFLCDRAGEAPPPGAFPGRAPTQPPLDDAC